MSRTDLINIDFHTHILPGMDDGATDENVSKDQLLTLYKQGVRKVFLTSHFDFRKEETSAFVARRQRAYDRLMRVYEPDNMPRLYLGAEIYMSRGMDQADYTGLMLQDTGYYLVEFPREPFQTWMFDVIEGLIFERRMKIMIAHVNRVTEAYDKKICRSLFDYSDLLFQLNTEAFRGFFASDPLGGYDVDGLRFVLGTDTHNMTDRAPDFDRALRKLKSGKLSYMAASMAKMTSKLDAKLEKI